MSAAWRYPDTRSIPELIAGQKPGYALERRFYTDPAIYELELEKIICKNWILAGHESELPNPGDFKVLKVANESAIIIRAKDGTINAFANVCLHRGSLVCLESKDNKQKLTCPYHGWMYDIEGQLIVARNMPEDFDKASHGLHRVSVDVVHGLLVVCFSDAPPSLDGAKRELAEPMSMFGGENLKVAAHK